jgi:nitrite reductase/ring-hydroxylating ferredoxin subunit
MIAGIAIGPVERFASLPVRVTVADTPFWLVRAEDGGLRLLLDACPHAGGELRPAGGLFVCPLHLWTFDVATGDCLNVPGERLRRFRTEVREGVLYAAGEED